MPTLIKEATGDLYYHTPLRWATEVLKNPLPLLSDHAYLERKATSNVLELLNRWPQSANPEKWITILSSVAKDEAQHLNAVIQILIKRGGKLQRLHRSDYANDLRKLVRMGHGDQELLDRLLISALIEARSYERFVLLSQASDDSELKKFYHNLSVSENGHYHVFIQLAEQTKAKEEVERRWEQLKKDEATIIALQKPGPTIHSGHQ